MVSSDQGGNADRSEDPVHTRRHRALELHARLAESAIRWTPLASWVSGELAFELALPRDTHVLDPLRRTLHCRIMAREWAWGYRC